MEDTAMPYVALALRLTLAGVFLVSALMKARSIGDTVAMWTALLKSVRLTGGGLARAASWTLIGVEAVTGVALLAGGALSTPALVAAMVLLSIFSALAMVAARAKLNVACACFGRAAAPLGRRHVWRNLVLLGIAVAGVAVQVDVPLEAGGIAVAAGAAVVITSLTAFYDDIVDLVGGA
ncbi:MauE/DoxX family redox-associated membrane protein [Streptosporangium sp. NPDC000396]|uniref:MauE/DoxX family redox-associated membrane protein n=1 Tax=Streptosporangium sp. NPDC000396 TaxID=3366185 RepID=UPI0036B50A66